MSDTPTPTPPPPPKRRRVSRKHSGLRNKRILQRLREGRSHSAIALEEGLTVRRLREILKQALDEDERVTPAMRRAEAEIARLAPALALAEAKIAEGDLDGVRALLALQKQLDVYAAASHGVDAPEIAAEGREAVEKVTRLMLHADPRKFAHLAYPAEQKKESPV